MKTKILEWFRINYSDLYQKMEKCEHTHSNGSVNPFHQENFYCR